ncbi:MAG TPA: hypothetical protein VE400_02470 [Mycobacterium sp.]|jgi:hypothetical protein|nr:hypothetical protein [Mycobacterium sp.]
MQQNTVVGRHDTHHSFADALWNWRAEALWVLAGVILMLAFGDAFIVLALAVAIVAVAVTWLTLHNVENRVERNGAETASVSHLRSARAGKRDSSHAQWRGPSAA